MVDRVTQPLDGDAVIEGRCPRRCGPLEIRPGPVGDKDLFGWCDSCKTGWQRRGDVVTVFAMTGSAGLTVDDGGWTLSIDG